MFKNLKKKIEDVGSDLSTLASPGSLGSLSSLRHSGSKASALGTSRESIQSESAASRTIITAPVFEDELVQPVMSSPQEEDSLPFDLTLEEVPFQLTLPDQSFNEQFDEVVSPSKPSLEVFEPYENGETLMGDVSGSFSEDWLAVQNDTVDFSVPSKITENKLSALTENNLLPSANPETETRGVSLVDQPISDTPGLLLSPALVRTISNHGGSAAHITTPVCDHRNFEEKIVRLTAELESKKQELQKSKMDLLSQETERTTFRAELERLKDVTAMNRLNEEKLAEATSKVNELQQHYESAKLEKDSWKIAHDQAVQRLKEKSSLALNSAKKVTDLEAKLGISTGAAADYQKELDRVREENSSLKSTMAILENQIDKFLADLQKEKSSKEKALDEAKSLNEEVSSSRELIKDLRSEVEKLESELKSERVNSSTNFEKSTRITNLELRLKESEEKLLVERKEFEDQTKRTLQLHEEILENLRAEISQKEASLLLADDELQDKAELVSSAEASVSELKSQISTLQEELESKEGAMAIFRRRSAKDTETKLRERDRQIASLENQLSELAEKTGKVDESAIEGAGHEYMKNVLLKFVSGTGDERLQMLKAVSVILKMSEAEETWLKNVIIWKQSWLPGPKPELSMAQNGHGHVNDCESTVPIFGLTATGRTKGSRTTSQDKK